METAKKILDENKKLNGPVINIIPLDFIELNNNEENSTDSEEENAEWILNDTQNNNNINNKSIIKRKDIGKTQLAGAKSFLDFIKINEDFLSQNPTINQKKLEMPNCERLRNRNEIRQNLSFHLCY